MRDVINEYHVNGFSSVNFRYFLSSRLQSQMFQPVVEDNRSGAPESDLLRIQSVAFPEGPAASKPLEAG